MHRGKCIFGKCKQEDYVLTYLKNYKCVAACIAYSDENDNFATEFLHISIRLTNKVLKTFLLQSAKQSFHDRHLAPRPFVIPTNQCFEIAAIDLLPSRRSELGVVPS